MTSPPVILASASASRAKVLKAAGVLFAAIPAHADEAAVKQNMQAQNATALQCAAALAELKAMAISRSYPGALVIGADQMLECQGAWFDKPPSRLAARAQLITLAGKTHLLPTATVIVRDGARIWEHLDTPRLTMRPFDEAFVDSYLEQAGAAVLQSVGAYQLEDLGAQLFQTVEGDFFTILGLPLLPLLAFLRKQGVVGIG